MKKILLLLCFLFAILPCIGQTHCASDILLENRRAKNPAAFGEAEQRLNTKISSPERRMHAGASLTPDTEIRIPVVVHIIHKGEPVGNGSNISYSQVQSQIDALNAAFSNYSDLPNYLQAGVGTAYDIPERRGLHGVDTKVRFCLAPNLGPIAPNGQQIAGQPGVIRYNNETLSRHDMTESGQEALMGLTHPTAAVLPANHFFNIWVVSAIRNGGPIISGDVPGIAGYAPIPVDIPYVDSWPLRGVVIRHDMFGDNTVNGNNFTLQPNFTQGKVFIHELGHALGLYHTFHTYSQSSASPCDLNYGDLVSDTPPCSMNNLGLYYSGQAIRNTCTNDSPDANDMLEDFMYYSEDAVRNTFTAGQKERMRAVIEEIYGEMVGDQNLFATGIIGASGCFGPILSADFSLAQTGCIGQPIAISGIQDAGNLATSWNWTVTPAAAIANPTGASTTITFGTPGFYTLSLTVTGTEGTETMSQNISIASCILNECAVQNGNSHFIFGYRSHIDFNSGTPVIVNDIPFNNIQSEEANFTQSDENGNLLFYTDGNRVWNSQYQVVNNSNLLSIGLPSNPTQIIGRSTHQISAAPFPGHPGQYLLLIPPTSEEYSNYSPAKFKYSIVNASGPTMTVTSPVTIKSTSLPERIHEIITVVPHCNGRDYWAIICDKIANNNSVLYAYLVTEAGLKLIATNPITTFGAGYLSPWGYGMRASRDGTKLVLMLEDRIAVVDFDPVTGMAGNQRSIMKDDPDATIYDYQAILSPSGNKCYAKVKNVIKVYDVTGTQLVLNNPSLYAPPVETIQGYHGLFLGSDDNIYFPDNKATSCLYAQSKSLTQIANADTTPVVSPNFLTFESTDYCSGILGGLPTPVDACKPDLQAPSFTMNHGNCNQVAVSLQGCFNQYDVAINWGDSTAPTTGLFSALMVSAIEHTYATPGQYTVTLTLSMTAGLGDANSDGILDMNTVALPAVSQMVSILDAAAPIMGSVSVCPGSQPVQYLFNAGLTGNYTWSVSGSGNSIVGPSSGIGINSVNVNWQTNGTVSVDYSDSSCSYSKQLAVAYICPELGIRNPDMQQLEYHPNPVNGLLDIRFDGGITKVTVFNVVGQRILEIAYNATNISVDFSGLQSGNYFVKVESGASQKVIKIIKQ